MLLRLPRYCSVSEIVSQTRITWFHAIIRDKTASLMSRKIFMPILVLSGLFFERKTFSLKEVCLTTLNSTSPFQIYQNQFRDLAMKAYQTNKWTTAFVETIRIINTSIKIFYAGVRLICIIWIFIKWTNYTN